MCSGTSSSSASASSSVYYRYDALVLLVVVAVLLVDEALVGVVGAGGAAVVIVGSGLDGFLVYHGLRCTCSGGVVAFVLCTSSGLRSSPKARLRASHTDVPLTSGCVTRAIRTPRLTTRCAVSHPYHTLHRSRVSMTCVYPAQSHSSGSCAVRQMGKGVVYVWQPLAGIMS